MRAGYLCSRIINGGLVNAASGAPGVSQLSKCRCLALQLHWLYWLRARLPTLRCFPLRNHCVGMSQALDFSLPRHPVHMQTPTLQHSHWGVCNLELRPALVMCPGSWLVYKAWRRSWDPWVAVHPPSSTWTGRRTSSSQAVTMGELHWMCPLRASEQPSTWVGTCLLSSNRAATLTLKPDLQDNSHRTGMCLLLNSPYPPAYLFFSSRKANPGSSESRGTPLWALMGAGHVVFLRITVCCLFWDLLT